MIIKWNTGRMRIDPSAFLQQPDIARRFRKLLKLSRESDMVFGTDAIASWAAALRTEQERIRRAVKHETDLYQLGNDAVRKAHEAPTAPFSEQMQLKAKMEKLLTGRKNAHDKRMKALNRKLLLMKKLEKEVHP